MISVEEALDWVRRYAQPLAPRRARLGELLHLRLAEPIASQVDSPPFDKALVDGFAIVASDSPATLRITEMVAAGGVARGAASTGTTIRIMTGAPLPAGADAVVKWEDCEQIDDQTVRIRAAVKPGSCILRQGDAFRTGQIVLPADKTLGPLDIALLAEIGRAERSLSIRRPRVGVLPTGDELVAAHEPLGPGQIRNSNGPMLLASLAVAGAEAVDLGVGRDNVDDLREKIVQGLQCDVLLISGGVSAGVKDLVPGVLAELGVEEHFHQVRVKPGKPLWFGTREFQGQRTLVFGLPGNPVSTLVSFRLFVLPALAALAGGEFHPPSAAPAVLSQAIAHRGQRPTYHPCRLVEGRVEPLDWRGSADLATLTRADCLAVLPEGDYQFEAGDEVDVLPL